MMGLEIELYNLAVSARNGDMAALSELVERFRMKLFALAYSQVHNYDDAQDSVASAILKMCLHINKLKEPASICVWMQSIVRNEARLILRKPYKDCMALDPDELASIADKSEMSILDIDIRTALKRLPHDQSRSLALFYLAGIPIQEIADRLGRPAGTIKRWLHQGRLNLGKEMEDYTMKTEITASIIHTELDNYYIQKLADDLVAAGFDKVNVFSDMITVSQLAQTGETDKREFHISELLSGSKLIILDEWLGGRSAFELHTILKASIESSDMGFCMLTSHPTESTVFAAWAAGADMFFNKESMGESFRACLKTWLKQQK